jgi:hypothetical protein
MGQLEECDHCFAIGESNINHEDGPPSAKRRKCCEPLKKKNIIKVRN